MKSETSFPLPFNQYGHMTIEVTGLGLTGKEEIARLESSYRIGERARSLLQGSVYNQEHRLVPGLRYKLVIVRLSQIEQWIREGNQDWSRSDNLLQQSRQFLAKFQYRLTHAESAVRLREMITDEQLAGAGLCSLVMAHKTIRASGQSVCLHVVHHTRGPTLGAGRPRILNDCANVGAVAFFDANP